MNNYGYIYKTTNLINSKIYIGQRKGEFNSSYLGSGKLIGLALQKYGLIHFKMELIAWAKNKLELDELEKFYIAESRKLLSCKNVYNIADGGGTVTGFRHSIAFIESMLGDKNVSKRLEVRKKLSRAKVLNNPMKRPDVRAKFVGENNPMYGRSRPDVSLRVTERNRTNNPMSGLDARAKLSEFMLKNNPMKDPDIVAKHVHSRWHKDKVVEECLLCQT